MHRRLASDTASTAKVAERPVLEVANLVTRFDIRSGILGRVHARVHAVEDISFSLHAGEPLALGKEFEINEKRAIVVGICKASAPFQTRSSSSTSPGLPGRRSGVLAPAG